MKCSICDIELDNKNTKTIGIKTADNNFICISCNEINDFFYEEKKLKKEIIKESIDKAAEEKIEIKSSHLCVKCNKSYDGIKCNICNFQNPLYIRKKKKKKLKKNK